MTHTPTTPEPPEFPSTSIVDSRRLTGPNLYCSHPGAVLEISAEALRVDALIAAWRDAVSSLLRALHWPARDIVARRDSNGASLFLSAPVDVLMTATEVNEQAWNVAEHGGAFTDAVVARLSAMAREERETRPLLAATYATAVHRKISVTFDDEEIIVGSGAGARVWPIDSIPADIDWATIRDVPIAVITGSNGKTTTTRLIAAMWRAAGVTPGWSCSDGVTVGDTELERGDFSGPAGAREVLRDARVGAAVLETARGGMLRRGLAVTRADAAIITNIAADHFGEYGVESLGDLAAVKGIVTRVLDPSACLVLNADDPELVAFAPRATSRVAWFSALSEPDAHIGRGGDSAAVDAGRLVLHVAGARHDVGAVDEMPITLGGAATHNVQNALGAALLGAALGIPVDAIRATLATFGSSPADNPGRLQIHHVRGVTVLVDYAHNPDGLRVLCETAASMPARRRLIILGQAGNRDDDQIRALARAAFAVTPFDRAIVKEMPSMLRGRPLGEISRLLVDELRLLGVADARVGTAPTELDAVRDALTWAEPGDLIVCPTHTEKTAVLALLEQSSV